MLPLAAVNRTPRVNQRGFGKYARIIKPAKPRRRAVNYDFQ
jgi:hypothetical protein